MSTPELSDEFFTVFSDALIPEPLLLVPLTATATSSSWPPIKGAPGHVYVGELMQQHLSIRLLVDALRLAYGCLDMGTAADQSAIVPTFRRWEVFPVVNGRKADDALPDDALDTSLQGGQGVFFSVHTYRNGERVPVNLEQIRPEFSNLLHNTMTSTGGITSPRSSSFAKQAVKVRKSASCRFLGRESVLDVIHVFDRRWSEQLLCELQATTQAMFDEFIASYETLASKFDFEETHNQYGRPYASVMAPPLGFDLQKPLMDSVANAAFSSPTCHELLDDTKLLLYCDTSLYVYPAPSTTILMRAREQAAVSSGAAVAYVAPVIKDISVTDSSVAMLWDVRFAIGILTKYSSVYLGELLANAKTKTVTECKDKKTADDSDTAPQHDDEHPGDAHEDEDNRDPGPSTKRRRVDGGLAASVSRLHTIVSSLKAAVDGDQQGVRKFAPVREVLQSGQVVYDPSQYVEALDEEGMQWCAFIIANLKAQLASA